MKLSQCDVLFSRNVEYGAHDRAFLVRCEQL
jgi:hypothetical protein